MTRSLRVCVGCAAILLLAIYAFVPSAVYAQQTLGSIDGTVTDSSGAVVPQAGISVRNVGTNLTVTAQTKGDGSFSVAALPIGTYEVTITKQGFEKAVYPQILVQGNLTATVNATLQPGEITTSVTVNATPLLNQTDTSNGYTLGTDVIQSTPLGTGSFTQLALLAPGTSADFLSGSGSNEGLGNQGIWANGQRDTSNSFTFNSVNSDNLFNGNSTCNMADSRFTLNTGEIFGAGGQVQTNTSVYDAIGEGLPTPPTETIQELQVTTSMYDASMGQKSGAHIELTTISGTNNYHGQAYEYFQNSALDAAPTFVVKNPFFSGAPPLHRNVFGGTIGGPIKKDKLFFFASYQRQQLSDALNGTFNGVPTLAGLTDADRTDTTALVNLVNFDAGLTTGSTPGGPCTNSSKVKCITTAQIDPVALNLFQLKLKNGQHLIPSDSVAAGTLAPESSLQKFNSAISGPPSTFNADQANANIDYNFSSSDRISAKYYFQNDPTTSPFAVSQVNGFPQTLQAGSQVFSLDNTTVVSPNATWEQRFGFVRQIASATTGQALTPGSVGLTLPNGELFPGITIGYADEGATSTTGTIAPLHGDKLSIGPSTNFANAGVFQNQFEGSSKYDWVLGKHTLSFGGTYDYTQFNVDNRENDVANLAFYDFSDFLTGTLGTAGTRGPTKLSGVTLLDGETNRHFRAKTVGLYAQDDFKILPNLTVNLGVRWDWDGPLYEANGLLTNFDPKDFGYDLTTDTFNAVNGTPGIGLVIAGNNKTFGTKGVSDSTLTGRQWGFAPRIGVAWSPRKNLVVRAGFGMFYDRGEYFSELSTSAGLGISGPFSVTTQQPFTIPILSPSCANALNCLSNTPFGTTLPAPPTTLAGVAALVPNMRQMSACNQATAPGLQQPNQPYCNVNGFSTALPFLFGGYAPTNVLPYSENWSLDLQWQPNNDLVVTLGYVGNRGVHEVLPIPFNQPEIATPSNPVNNQIYSYGYLAATPTVAGGCDGYNDSSATCIQLPAEEVQTQLGHYSFSDGNTALRSPYIGISPNADLWTTNGISFYNALQLSVTKRMSHGLQFNASYTYSHALDEGSGLGAGLFFNGNNPLDPRTSYASSDFDRTHVFIVSYLYDFPTIKDAHGLLNVAANGWGITGVTTLETGEPFSIVDFSGTAGGIYYSADDYITNPLLPLAPGVTPQQASSRAGGGGNLVNGLPYVNPNDFFVPSLAPGTDGVPPCETVTGYSVCDNYETGYGTTGRNIFREPFQTRFDFSVFKNFKLTERFNLKFEADAFNLFNHPSLDAPYSDFTLNPCYNPVPCYTTTPPSYEGYGAIDGTIGSNRFMQFALHLTF